MAFPSSLTLTGCGQGINKPFPLNGFHHPRYFAHINFAEWNWGTKRRKDTTLFRQQYSQWSKCLTQFTPIWWNPTWIYWDIELKFVCTNFMSVDYIHMLPLSVQFVYIHIIWLTLVIRANARVTKLGPIVVARSTNASNMTVHGRHPHWRTIAHISSVFPRCGKCKSWLSIIDKLGWCSFWCSSPLIWVGSSLSHCG